MEKDAENEDFIPSEDLVRASEQQLELLEAIDNRRDLYEGPMLAEAIRRYILCWLPLVSKSDIDDVLLPPIDIQWVWYCHALDTLQYHQDIKQIVGSKINHYWIGSSKRKHATAKAAKYWSDNYTNEPFQLERTASETGTIPENLIDLSKRLERCVNQERDFYYQVSLPHYKNDSFMHIALARYQKFLSSTKMRSSSQVCEILTDVELLWRSHILYTDSYTQDCKKWFGHVLDHTASLMDQCPQTKNCSPIKIKMEQDDEKSPDSKQIHNVCSFSRRGESPIGRLIVLPEDEKDDMSAKVCEINIEEILIEGYRIDDKGTRISTSVELTGKREKHHVSKCLIEFAGSHYNPEEKKPINFAVDPQRYDSVTLSCEIFLPRGAEFLPHCY